MRTLRFLIDNLDHFRLGFWLSFAAAFLDGIALFLIPVLLSEFTKTDLDFHSFLELVPYLIGCFALSLGLQWVIRRWGEALSLEFGNYLRFKYFGKVESLRMDLLLEHRSGHVLSLVSTSCTPP